MEILALGAAQLGLALTPQQLDQFEEYHRELGLWNQRVNLTAITQYPEVQAKHFVDSLTVCLAVPGGMARQLWIVDVGTGAGFPGLPLKLAFPDIRLSLVESVGKKTRFLEHLVATLGLSGVEVHAARAEELARQSELRETFDLAVSRGVASVPALLEYTLPFCRLGGRAALLKHGGIENELSGASRALDLLGGRLEEVHPVRVAGLADDRVVVAFEKVHSTPAKYPRRPGMPVKRPL
ncbi:MAG: 16S rRNA (guanine(527)-N(7))-methyltransferase RsmG [Dehalococcoidia bacterium]|jgi:16S rRNA (guanine527-N7)-methyltransferase|nr:16S rRNA (guanine(527)-N(7))-methyltransferase RsmG [Dehalococcoidia bacterium]